MIVVILFGSRNNLIKQSSCDPRHSQHAGSHAFRGQHEGPAIFLRGQEVVDQLRAVATPIPPLVQIVSDLIGRD